MTDPTRAKLAAAAVAVLMLAGCMPPGSDTVMAAGTESAMPIWTDPLTGCDYIAPTGYMDNPMPRISADGFHVLCREQKQALSRATQPEGSK